MRSDKVKVFIIEDDEEWLSVLKKIFSHPNFEIIGSAYTHSMVKDILPKLNPDIIIADVVIQNKYIFSTLEENLFKEHRIIFITTHLEKEVFEKAQKFKKSSFAAKPLHPFTIFSIIDLLLSKYPNEGQPNGGFITVRGKQQQQKKVYLNEIVCVNVQGNYCFINTLDDKKHVRKISLNNIQKEINSEIFIQIHKRYIINLRHINRIDLGNNFVFLKQYSVPIGRNFKKNLNTYLDKVE